MLQVIEPTSATDVECPAALKGKLTRASFGFSMPVDAPLYPSPPYFYKDASLLIFNYLTDPQAAAAALPAQVEVPEAATAGLVFARYPWSSLGAYDEVVLFLNCIYQGRPLQYPVVLYVTTDAAMAAGREMGGFPKKIGKISIDYAEFYSASLERPAGLPICSAVLRPEAPVVKIDPAKPMVLNYLSMRVIPSPQKGTGPAVAELIETSWLLTSGEIWSGTGSCSFTGASAVDPLHRLPVVTALGCDLIRGEMTVAANEDDRQHAI